MNVLSSSNIWMPICLPYTHSGGTEVWREERARGYGLSWFPPDQTLLTKNILFYIENYGESAGKNQDGDKVAWYDINIQSPKPLLSGRKMILLQEKKKKEKTPPPPNFYECKVCPREKQPCFVPLHPRPTQKNLTTAKMAVWSKGNLLVIIAPTDTSKCLTFGEKLHRRVLMIIWMPDKNQEFFLKEKTRRRTRPSSKFSKSCLKRLKASKG